MAKPFVCARTGSTPYSPAIGNTRGKAPADAKGALRNLQAGP